VSFLARSFLVRRGACYSIRDTVVGLEVCCKGHVTKLVYIYSPSLYFSLNNLHRTLCLLLLCSFEFILNYLLCDTSYKLGLSLLLNLKIRNSFYITLSFNSYNLIT